MDDAGPLHMRRALELAARGRGAVEPNPMVGAVVVANGVVAGEGHHERFGGPHAEVAALDAAGTAARGGDLYVTLEPCCHSAKTPPCTDRILSAGIRRVVAAMADPFPMVAGKGFERLRQAGIAVEVGLLEREAMACNAPYLKLLSTGRPFVHAKWAMTLDGKIATARGESKWITGTAAREHAQQFRGIVDAIVVGIGTALADDPSLTARPPGPRTPLRVVVDSQARLSMDCKLVRTAQATPTLVAVGRGADQAAVERLEAAGCEVLSLPTTPRGRVDLTALIVALGGRRFTNVLVEGGSELIGSFFDDGLVDAVRVYLAPSIVGGMRAPTPVGGFGIDRLQDRWRVDDWQTQSLGGDCFLHGRLIRAGE